MKYKTTYRYQYNGKERQTAGSLSIPMLDYGARMYNSRIGRWSTMDPLAEKYYSTSPYAFCANNPIRYIDPDGRQIDEINRKEWERNKAAIEQEMSRSQQRMDKLISSGRGANRIAGLEGNIAGMQSTLATMSQLESSSQVYGLGGLDDSGLGALKYNSGSGVITIGYSGTYNFVHEITHAGQFETGDIAFTLNGQNTLAQDVYDEVSAYKAQYAYNPSSVSGLSSNSSIRTSADITPKWVQGLLFNGGPIYTPDGSARTGLYHVNINSTKAELMRAYPKLSLPGVSNNQLFKNFHPMYYKK